MERPMIDTARLERVAFASSAPDVSERFAAGEGVGHLRWTELGLYHRPGERRPWVAESWGRSTMPGEREFRRQRVSKTAEDACGLFDSSRLSDVIVDQLGDWEDLRDAPPAPGQPPAPIGFDGAGALMGALRWLYEAPDASEGELSARFEHDWGVPARTVRYTLKRHREGEELPSWCKAFLGALQHFDRATFNAVKRP